MATYDYSNRKPADGAFDYPAKINFLIDDLSADVTLESNRSDAFETELDWITVTSFVNLTSIDTKLASIENGATADQSDSEIKIAYENNADTNAFTDSEVLLVASALQTKADVDALGINAALLDNINSTSFLRSDVSDIKTAGNLTLNDNVYLRLGTSSDIEIFHNGTNSYFDNNTGIIYFRYGTSNRIAYTINATYLYYQGNQKLVTTSTGVDITGGLTLDAALALTEGGTGGTTRDEARSGVGIIFGILDTQASPSITDSNIGGTWSVTRIAIGNYRVFVPSGYGFSSSALIFPTVMNWSTNLLSNVTLVESTYFEVYSNIAGSGVTDSGDIAFIIMV